MPYILFVLMETTSFAFANCDGSTWVKIRNMPKRDKVFLYYMHILLNMKMNYIPFKRMGTHKSSELIFSLEMNRRRRFEERSERANFPTQLLKSFFQHVSSTFEAHQPNCLSLQYFGACHTCICKNMWSWNENQQILWPMMSVWNVLDIYASTKAHYEIRLSIVIL